MSASEYATLDNPQFNPIASNCIHVEAANYSIYHVGAGIQRYWLPILIPVGLVGNILSLIIMTQKHNRHISTCCYLAALAVTDSCMLLIATHYWITMLFARRHVQIECRVVVYLFQMFSLLGVCFIVAVTVDRFLAVCFPIKAKIWCSTRRAKISIAVLSVLAIAYTSPYIFLSGIVNNDICTAIAWSGPANFGSIYSSVNMQIYAIFPFVLILSLNGAIVVIMRRRKTFAAAANISAIKNKRGCSVYDVTSTARCKSRKLLVTSTQQRIETHAQLTVTLFLVTLTFVCLTLPQYIRYRVYQSVDVDSDPYVYAQYYFWYNLTNKLYFTHNGINFFLYCISGSRFKRDLKYLMYSCMGNRPNSRNSQR